MRTAMSVVDVDIKATGEPSVAWHMVEAGHWPPFEAMMTAPWQVVLSQHGRWHGWPLANGWPTHVVLPILEMMAGVMTIS